MNSKKISELYNARFEKTGAAIGTLGWGSKESQNLRFEVLLQGLKLEHSTIVDFGCGFGDLATYIRDQGVTNYKYIGLDISESFIAYSKIAHEQYPNHIFIDGSLEKIMHLEVDYVIISGAFSLNIPGMKTYTFRTLEKAFSISNKGVACNFLSKNCDYQRSKDIHYSPFETYRAISRFAKFINVYQTYGLYEFTVQILKGRSC